jgi:Peptidase family M28
MPEVGFEPTRPCGHGLLRAASLPFLHSGAAVTIERRAGDNPPLVDAHGRMEIIRGLCSFEGRLTGTDAERRAANWLAERLRAQGRRAEVEPTYVHPQVGLVLAAHAALGFGGSLLAIAEPVAGFAIVLAAAASLYFDLNTRFYLLRRLFFRRASQNVFSPGRRTDAPARLILVAHYDAARTGYIYNESSRRRQARVPPGARRVLAPPRLLFWSLALLIPILGARTAGLDESWLSLIQLLPTLVLLVATFLLVDIQLSEVVPGANDNASGVALALSAAETLDADPPRNLDVCVLFTGGNECLMEGMRSFVRSYRKRPDRDSSYFVALEMLGRGPALGYLTAEGLAVTYKHSTRLAQLAEAIATASREGGGNLDAEPIALPTASDALPPTLAGYPALTLRRVAANGLPGLEHHTQADAPEGIEPDALAQSERFVIELVRQLDRDVGRRADER